MWKLLISVFKSIFPSIAQQQEVFLKRKIVLFAGLILPLVMVTARMVMTISGRGFIF